MVEKLIRFLTRDIWHMSMSNLSKTNASLIHYLRIITLSIRGYIEDRVGLRASALTFFTLLSVVPVLAMAFGIAKGFGMKQILQTQLKESLEGHEEVLNYMISFADSMLENTQGGWMAGIGIIILLWSVIKVLWNIEISFNHIWQVTKERTPIRKLSDYLSIIIIGPIFIILSGSMNIYISTQLSKLTQEVSLLERIGPLIFYAFRLTPFIMTWTLLTLLYMVMPNTNVRFKSALVAGIFAGTILQVVQWAYIHFQVGVSQYNAIYGSFAAFPLFLIFLQTAWLIVLLGAEISFAHQNVSQFEFEEDIIKLSLHDKQLASLTIMHGIVKAFEKGEQTTSIHNLAVMYKAPVRLISHLIKDLHEANLIEEVTDDKNSFYVPATDIHKINIEFVLNALNNFGSGTIRIEDEEPLSSMNRLLDNIGAEIKSSKSNVLLMDIPGK
jgi:membrane protein